MLAIARPKFAAAFLNGFSELVSRQTIASKRGRHLEDYKEEPWSGLDQWQLVPQAQAIPLSPLTSAHLEPMQIPARSKMAHLLEFQDSALACAKISPPLD